MDTFAG